MDADKLHAKLLEKFTWNISDIFTCSVKNTILYQLLVATESSLCLDKKSSYYNVLLGDDVLMEELNITFRC